MAEAKTGALNVGAMYQVGSQGAGNAKKKENNFVDDLLQFAGKQAWSYLMESRKNFKLIKKQDNKMFQDLSSAYQDSELINDPIAEVKMKLTNAHKILNSAQWKLFHWHPTYKQAAEDEASAYSAIDAIRAGYNKFPEFDKLQNDMVNRTNVVGEGTANEKMSGYSLGSTAEEIYNTSLWVSGKMKNALFFNTEKNIWEIVVDKVSSWDDPLTDNVIETEDDYFKRMELGQIKAIPLSSMKFAKPDNPNLADYGNDHVSYWRDQGKSGKNWIKSEMRESKNVLKKDINQMTPVALANYVFNGAQYNAPGDVEDISIIDKLINNRIKQQKDLALEEWDVGGESGEGAGDGVINEIERLGAREMIKAQILDPQKAYNRDDIVNLFHDAAWEQYDSSKILADAKARADRNADQGNMNLQDNNLSLLKAFGKDESIPYIVLNGTKWARDKDNPFQVTGIREGKKESRDLSNLLSLYASTYSRYQNRPLDYPYFQPQEYKAPEKEVLPAYQPPFPQ